MPSYQLHGKSRYGDLYIGHRTDSPASAIAKFIRWKYRHLGQRYVDRQFLLAIDALRSAKAWRFRFEDYSLELSTDPRPATKR